MAKTKWGIAERLARALRVEARSRGRLDALRRLQATLFRKQVEQNDKVCPECNHHFPVSAVERIRPASRSGHLRGLVLRPPAGRPAGLRRPPALSRTGQGRAGADRAERGRPRRPGVHQGNPHRLRDHRQQLHHGNHGLGRRREAHPGHRGGDAAEAPAGDRLRLGRRRPDARGDLLADADGQGLDGPGPLPRRRAACSSAS